jgi:hypothetical protein
MECDYKGVFALGILVSLFLFYISHIISIVIQEKREKDIKERR